MDSITITNNIVDQLLLGNNEFKTVTMTVPAGETIAAGEILHLGALEYVEEDNTGSIVDNDGTKYVQSEGSGVETHLAVYVGDPVTNDTLADVDVKARVCVAGRVNQALLTVEGSAATDTEADHLRGWGILPQVVHDFSKLDRQ